MEADTFLFSTCPNSSESMVTLLYRVQPLLFLFSALVYPLQGMDWQEKLGLRLTKEVTMFDKIPETWIPVLKDAGSALIVIIVVAILYILAVRGLKHAGKNKKLEPSVVSVGRILLRWIFFIFSVLFVLGEFGILENVWAAVLAVMGMVAVGFIAVWSVLSNTLCTLFILIYKPFRIGDIIEIPADSLKGKVIDLNLLFTTLREESGELIQLPNNFFFQKASRRKLGEETIDIVKQLAKSDPTG